MKEESAPVSLADGQRAAAGRFNSGPARLLMEVETMPDREKVIKICEEVIKVGSPYGTDAMTYSFYYDVIALLKELERNPVIVCPHCGRRVK